MVYGHSKVRIMKHDFDYVISLSLPKTHDFIIATLGIKSIMASVHRHDRIHIHGIRGKVLLQTVQDAPRYEEQKRWKE
jgi:uncharacterized protein (DUF362 family)